MLVPTNCASNFLHFFIFFKKLNELIRFNLLIHPPTAVIVFLYFIFFKKLDELIRLTCWFTQAESGWVKFDSSIKWTNPARSLYEQLMVGFDKSIGRGDTLRGGKTYFCLYKFKLLSIIMSKKVYIQARHYFYRYYTWVRTFTLVGSIMTVKNERRE